MEKKTFVSDGRTVCLYSAEAPQILFLQPVDAHDASLLGRQIEAMQGCALPFALAAFQVEDWNRDLSPWEAPPVFGKTPFCGGAEETLRFVTDRLLPDLKSRLSLRTAVRLCIGGYSLAGLFALWAASQTAAFSGAAAASPSVWFPGWIEYSKAHPLLAAHVYLSLGDREARTKNPVIARVADCIWEQYALLQPGHTVTLEWNPGNHFQEPELRTAKAFYWLAVQEIR